MYIGSYLEDALSLVHADQEVASYFGNNVSASLGDQLRFDFKLLDTEQRESLIAGFDVINFLFHLCSFTKSIKVLLYCSMSSYISR